VCAFSPRLIGQRRLFLGSGFPEGCTIYCCCWWRWCWFFFLVIYRLLRLMHPVCTRVWVCVCVCILGSYYSHTTLVEKQNYVQYHAQYDSIVFAVRKRDGREVRESIIYIYIYSDFFWLKKKLFLGSPPKGLTSKRFRLCSCAYYICKIIVRIREMKCIF